MASKRDQYFKKLFMEAEGEGEGEFSNGQMTIYFKDLTPEARAKVYELIAQYDEFADAFDDDVLKAKIDLYLFGGQREDGSMVDPIPVSVINGSQLRDKMTL